MPKNTNQDIKDLGFIQAMYGVIASDDLAFAALIDAVLAEQALILEGRIGSTAYASTTSPMKDYVKRAEKCLAAAELVQRRINVILGNAVGSGQDIDISHEGAQKKAYRDEADMWMGKIVAGAGQDNQDFACGSLVTSHFGDEDA
jgi:hypothetical protein